ncbi:MAG: LysR family transcriptional regulator [Microbacterium sp.]|uniref:LysR substrate-binding domain-containing protein n=1 Tax=Microbacterium sp. TaxID=51671 RepID=UPI001AD464AB|nr:LysR substrate-binding domain-containing protein [Microbacterium sp.]MBN9153692.1 LysR family transcriptional regulator [Microbacterium sp.]
MDLRQMEYLITLADEEQFTRAAAICGVSQSGLSAAIRGLEDELGTSLFHRTTRRVEPTDAGRALIPHARALVAQAAAARDAVARTSRQLSGPMRVGSEQCLGVVDVVSMLDRVHRAVPEAELAFTQAGSHELVARVREGELDAAFVATTEHLGPLQRVELGRQRLIALLPPGDAPREGAAVSWADLRDREFVDFHESWAVRSLVDGAFAAHGITRHVRCTVNDVHTLLDLVVRGLGWAVVPAHVATKPQASDLRAFAMPEDAPWWIVSVVMASPPSAAAGVLVDFLRAQHAVLV